MTNLNVAVSASLAGILSINENIASLQEEAKAARKAAIEPFLEALAASGEVSLVVVRGHTPGFNDGEPCEHSAEMFVNIKKAKEEDVLDGDFGIDLPEELVEGLVDEVSYERPSYKRIVNEGALAANIALCREHGHVYGEPSAEILKALNAVIFDTVEEENETNYYVTYVLTDGKFEVSTGEYDCGY
ncbi:hypothetical protein [Rhizobium leucaenae]|uniref:hypothetical protein n=1 Tax=Rhizobium leucaenae TaxID=29450 RepID=UPI0007EE2A2B|nr:hypothetical protein [Rhizobium leucaenae]